MDIIVPTHFNNALLPIVPVIGFADTFSRADAAVLGSTEGANSKPWQIFNSSGSSTWSIAGSSAQMTASTANSFAIAESYLANGTLQATVKSAGTSHAGYMVARFVDASNNLILCLRQGAGINRYVLSKRVAGVMTVLGTGAANQPSTDGDIVQIILNGSSIIVMRNGVSIITATDSAFSTATKYGFQGVGATYDIAWDNISMVA